MLVLIYLKTPRNKNKPSMKDCIDLQKPMKGSGVKTSALYLVIFVATGTGVRSSELQKESLVYRRATKKTAESNISDN